MVQVGSVPELRRPFAKGVMWSTVSSVTTSVTRLLTLAVLARLLTSSDFGLFALTLLVVDFGNDIGDLGTGPALIQRPTVGKRLLNAVFWAVLVGSLGLVVLSLAVAPLVSLFFKEPALRHLIAVASASFVFRSIGLVHRALLQRQLHFFRLAVVESGSILVFGVVSIGAAMNGHGVWSLVYGLLAHRAVDAALAWVMTDFRPGLACDWQEARKVLGFAANVFGERVTYYLSSRMDYIILGRFLGSTPLGYYTLASEMVHLPQRRISTAVSTVALPTFSRIQHDVERLRAAYLRVNKAVASVAFPILCLLGLFAAEIVQVVYGSGWEPVVVLMQILALAGCLKSIMHLNGSVFYSTNHPELAFRWALIQALTIPVPLIIGAQYGINGVATAVTLTYAVYFIYLQGLVGRLLHLSVGRYVWTLRKAVCACFALAALATAWRVTTGGLFERSPLVVLLTGGMLASLAYAAVLVLLDRSHVKELASLASDVLRGRATSTVGS